MFLNKENDYWPINAAQIIASDDVKWYGMNGQSNISGSQKNRMFKAAVNRRR